jgi:transcriptional regulator
MGSTPLVQGTLDLLILRALKNEELHGLGIARRVEHLSGNAFSVKAGSLFPALQRMSDAGWLVSSWGTLEGRRVKYYRLSAAGRKQLRTEAEKWRRVAGAMTTALQGI